MALLFLLDENLPRRFLRAIARHNARGIDVIDVICVGNVAELPLGSDDPTILSWAQRHGRILVSEDKHTLPGHLAEHLAREHSSPGVLLVKQGARIPEVLEILVLVAHASEASEWQVRIGFIP